MNQSPYSLRTVIGLDIGRSTVKAVTRSKNGNSAIQVMFPSIVAPAIEISTDSERSKAALDTVVVNGKSYFFGETAAIQSRVDLDSGMRDDWVFTDEHRALFLGAIKRLKNRGVERTENAIVVVGLPGKHYSNQRGALKDDLSKIYPEGQIFVLPQPLGPFQLMQFQSNGLESDELQRRGNSWGIIEIGQYTTDFCVVLNGRIVERCFGSSNGMTVVAENLQKLLAKRGISIGLEEASRAFVNRQIKHFGQVEDIGDEIDQSIPALAEDIRVKANALMGEHARSLDGILLAGGGAPLIFEHIRSHWPHAKLCDDSRFAVAEGFSRFGAGFQLHKQNQTVKAA